MLQVFGGKENRMMSFAAQWCVYTHPSKLITSTFNFQYAAVMRRRRTTFSIALFPLLLPLTARKPRKPHHIL